MDIIIRINNVSAEQLAHLLTSEKMGLRPDEVAVVHGNDVTPFSSISAAANVILRVWQTMKGFF